MREDQRFDRIAGMIEDRLAGMTYEEIGNKYGISRQRVGQIYGKYNRYNFKAIKECGCAYRNIRSWMNKNSVERTELIQMINGNQVEPTTAEMQRFYAILLGKKRMPDMMVGRLAEITGMSIDFVLETG